MVQFYGNITKVDAEQRMVWGYASTEAVDSDGEIIKRSAISEALEDYMKFANIREMHQPSAVGVAKEAFTDEKGLYIAAKVVDDDAWAKVAAGVYKGFSIGGKVLERDPVARKTITKVGLYEISLVDRPANPEATFDVWKVADPSKESSMKLEDLEKAEALALGKTADAEALAKAEADAAVLAKATADALAAEALAKAEADKITEVVVLAAAVEEDPVAKAAAALAELIAVVDAHTATVTPLNKFDAAMAALAALGDVGAPVVDLFKAAKVEADEALTKAVGGVSGEPMKGVVPEADLAKALATIAARDEAFAKMTDGMAALTKRISTLELQPMPAKTAGPGAGSIVVVEKGADASGSNAASAAAKVTLESDAVAKYLGSLSEDDRVHLIMKAAQATPINLGR
jgi:HK97 family phage prohead protease